MRKRLLLVLLVALMGAITPLAVSRAQDSAVTITLAVPAFNKQAFTDAVLGEFESSHPGIKVNVVTDTSAIPPAVSGLDAHLTAVQQYISSADVLFADATHLTVEGTRAGYYLDLSPLVSEDKSLNTDDFYPAIWQSFQWDKGIWALPTASDPIILNYDPAAFDKANLAYPNENWTMADLDNAVRKLAEKDADGNVITHGIDIPGNNGKFGLLRSLLSQGLYDPNTVPNAPQLDQPGLEDLMTTYEKLDADGLIGEDINKAPMSVAPAIILILPTDANTKRVGVLLPGGKAALDTEGYAVSAATQYPEQAYALAAWLTTRSDIAVAQFNGVPARQSLANTPADNGQTISLNIPADVLALEQQAVQKGFSVSELRYVDYIGLALTRMKTENLDSKSAIQETEAQAVKDLQAADDKKGKAVIAVATPVPNNVADGKISLKFDLTSFTNQLPYREKWDQIRQDFAANDPQVGNVQLDSTFEQLDQMATQYDCFYLPYNAVPNANPALMLSLDSFLGADQNFDKSDVVGNVMTQLTRDNKIWAYPIMIAPTVLKYDSDKFDKSAVPQPQPGWTIDQFKDAVKALKIDPKDPAPFQAPNTGGVHLLMLIAAYGGLPLDYRTDPPTINYTDPATVDAIRQVLDLAKDGYIKYDAVGNIMGGFNLGNNGPTAPIYTDALSLFSFRQPTNDVTTNNTYKPITFPRGSQYAAASYNIGTAYISAKSKNPEACYRWITTMAKHPDLFSAMPARRSLINDPTQQQAAGADATALYNSIDTVLQDPNTINFPSQTSGGANPTGFLLQHWLYQAFDGYVLHDKDLDSALKDAETISKGFQGCAANLPALDMSNPASAKQYINAFGKCATNVDPSLKTLFDLVAGAQ